MLARFSSAPTRRHWNGVKHILRYLRGTTDLGLFYSKESTLKEYADSGYLSNPHKAHSQTGYVFTCGNTAISWRSTKQTLTVTSSNHSKIIALHEASRKCLWLRLVVHHIRNACGLPLITSIPTTIYEDITTCIEQIKEGYIKSDRTKYISPKFFFTHELQKSHEIEVKQIRSSNNVVNLFIKALPSSTFKKLMYDIGMHQVCDQSS